MVTNRIIFFATSVQPNPEEIDYWVDLSDNPLQSMMKGYIYFKDGNPLYRMLKLNDSWTKCENYSAGGWRM